MRASVHVDLPGWTKEGLTTLQARCEELHLQPRGTRGESGGQTGELFLHMLCVIGFLHKKTLYKSRRLKEPIVPALI